MTYFLPFIILLTDLSNHHMIEERFVFPILAERMPQFKAEHLESHKGIHDGKTFHHIISFFLSYCSTQALIDSPFYSPNIVQNQLPIRPLRWKNVWIAGEKYYSDIWMKRSAVSCDIVNLSDDSPRACLDRWRIYKRTTWGSIGRCRSWSGFLCNKVTWDEKVSFVWYISMKWVGTWIGSLAAKCCMLL